LNFPCGCLATAGVNNLQTRAFTISRSSRLAFQTVTSKFSWTFRIRTLQDDNQIMFHLRQLVKLAGNGQKATVYRYCNSLLHNRPTYTTSSTCSSLYTNQQQQIRLSTLVAQPERCETNDLIAFAEKNQLKVIGSNAPTPILELEQFNWSEPIRQFLHQSNITEPTAIQAAAWPIVLSGRDLIGVSATGSGKTLAFLLPAVKMLSEPNASQTPMALVLTPTRELALQIESVARQLPALRTLCCYGGSSRDRQKMSLERYRPKLIIATPGRLNDLLSDRSIDLSNIQYLVLDEADRMLDMGFEPQIRTIIDKIPKERQTVMWR
jgi:hypothetical protein